MYTVRRRRQGVVSGREGRVYTVTMRGQSVYCQEEMAGCTVSGEGRVYTVRRRGQGVQCQEERAGPITRLNIFLIKLQFGIIFNVLCYLCNCLVGECSLLLGSRHFYLCVLIVICVIGGPYCYLYMSAYSAIGVIG